MARLQMMDKTPFDRGFDAGSRRGEYEFEYARGKPRNPYPAGTPERLQWFDGFMEGAERRIGNGGD
ncbi:MAG TPA: hypothetical protein VM491_20995 [Burkholderiaceae bacterium]|nr:hypothetical protein [Burkholderiaceae bacterium]